MWTGLWISLCNSWRTGWLLVLGSLLSVGGQAADPAKLSNRLALAPSPYLQAHATDPVAWQSWDESALALAQRLNRPMLVSLGYFACHWCHVMQQESYVRHDVAGVLNGRFVPVKVDRELEPALDADLLAFARTRTGAAGWPLHVLMTPEGLPFDAFVYLPPDQLMARLQQQAQRWERDAPAVRAQAGFVVADAGRVQPTPVSPAQQQRLTRALVQEAMARADELRGGFDGVRKFPQTPTLWALLQLVAQTPADHAPLVAWLKQTLDAMMQGGLMDVVHGGFFRYTVDPDWQQPHFEKMLADNALLVRLYWRAARVLGVPVYEQVARHALNGLLAQLADARGGVASSVSALDAQGREGGGYVWSGAALAAAGLSGAQTEWALQAEGGWLPTLSRRSLDDDLWLRLRQVRPSSGHGVDDKRLSGLNGLLLSALAEMSLHEPAWRGVTTELAAFVGSTVWRDGVLTKGRWGEDWLDAADLEASVYVAQGLLDYAIWQGQVEAGEQAVALLRQVWAQFVTDEGVALSAPVGGFSLPRRWVQADGATPAALAVLVSASLRTGQADLRARAQTLLAQAWPWLEDSPLAHVGMVVR